MNSEEKGGKSDGAPSLATKPPYMPVWVAVYLDRRVPKPTTVCFKHY